MKHIKFKKVETTKSKFFEWLTEALENNGWVNISSNPNSEGWIYQSKGESGKDNIIVNFRDGYDGHLGSNRFSTSRNKHFDIRMMVDYIPNEVSGRNGTHTPALSDSAFTRINAGVGLGSYMYNDQKITIHYNCNKNRMTFLFTNSATTMFCMFGRPDKKYAKEYNDTGNMIFTMYNYRLKSVGSWGIADRPTTAFTAMTPLYNTTDNGYKSDKLLFCEVGYHSTLEGFKGYLEGVYYVPTKGNLGVVTSMTGDKYSDELGNEYTLFYMMTTDDSSYPDALPTGHLAICTKLAGEE